MRGLLEEGSKWQGVGSKLERVGLLIIRCGRIKFVSYSPKRVNLTFTWNAINGKRKQRQLFEYKVSYFDLVIQSTENTSITTTSCILS